MKVWVEAARPRTLPAAVAPVLVGTAAAQQLTVWRFLAALSVGLAVQIGVNYANDLYDGLRGVDTADRVGPRRAVASGMVAADEMRVAMLAAFAVAAAAGLALAAATTWWLVVIGAAAFLAAVGYSGGPRPYASAGMGELFVFVFFGLVATIGSAYVQVETVPLTSVPAAVVMGLLASAILVVNNLRDIATDADAGKVTLAVRLGPRMTRRLYEAMVAGAFVAVGVTAWVAAGAWPLIGLLAAPFALLPLRTVRDEEGSGLIPALATTAALQLEVAVLLAIGLWAA